MVNKIANISNLTYATVAMSKLMNRQPGLPALGVYYGPSGFGKSTTISVVANETRSYYVQMLSVWGKKAFAEKICHEIGIKPASTVAGCVDLIIEQMGASQRPLIIDEADYAVKKPGMVDLIRDLYEGSKAPIMLVGEEELPNKLKRFERVHARVLAWLPAQPVSIEDAKKLAEVYAPDVQIASDLLNHLVQMAHGSVRRVSTNLVYVAEEALIKGLDAINKGDIDLSCLSTGNPPKRSVRV